MIRFGDYLSPRIYNEYWYDKPPIFYWMVAASFKIFGGFSEIAARLPAALMAIGAILMTALASARLFGARTGFWSGITMGTSVMLMYMGKASVTDTTLLFFVTAALFSFIHRHYWFMYIACGFAVMTKGPIGVVFPGAIIFFYLLLTHRLEVPADACCARSAACRCGRAAVVRLYVCGTRHGVRQRVHRLS